VPTSRANEEAAAEDPRWEARVAAAAKNQMKGAAAAGWREKSLFEGAGGGERASVSRGYIPLEHLSTDP
jgi:hypothetical protein